MRLDEWQKYIGSQFLDEEEEVVPAPKPNKQAVSPLLEFLPSEEVEANAQPVSDPLCIPIIVKPEPLLMDTTGQGARPETTPNAIQNVVTMLVTPPTAPDPVSPSTTRAPRIELLTPLPDQTPAQPENNGQPEISNRTRRRSQSVGFDASSHSATRPATDQNSQMPSASDTLRNRNLFQPIEDIDTEIPSFANYLPASHTAPALPDDAASSSIAASPSPASTCNEEDNIARFNENTKEAAQQEEIALEELPQEETLQEETPHALNAERRTSKPRARHARNVRPENVPSGLSASELWAAVPRHVQTLLSLERLEAEQEVAQFSYKRPFQEKRHELIERLLDPILSLEDTARLLNVCPTTVRRYTNKGILTYYRKEPDRANRNTGEVSSAGEKETRQRRFRLSDILAFLETQQAALAADRRAEGQAALLDADFAEDNGKEPLI